MEGDGEADEEEYGASVVLEGDGDGDEYSDEGLLSTLDSDGEVDVVVVRRAALLRPLPLLLLLPLLRPEEPNPSFFHAFSAPSLLSSFPPFDELLLVLPDDGGDDDDDDDELEVESRGGDDDDVDWERRLRLRPLSLETYESLAPSYVISSLYRVCNVNNRVRARFRKPPTISFRAFSSALRSSNPIFSENFAAIFASASVAKSSSSRTVFIDSNCRTTSSVSSISSATSSKEPVFNKIRRLASSLPYPPVLLPPLPTTFPSKKSTKSENIPPPEVLPAATPAAPTAALVKKSENI